MTDARTGTEGQCDSEVWVAANIERAELREQAWRVHKDNLEVEERRYQGELAHIDDVYKLRTGG